MKNFVKFLEGKKTYIVAVALIAYAVIVTGWSGGNWSLAGTTILSALGLSALRAAK